MPIDKTGVTDPWSRPMRTPTEYEIEQLLHRADYNPVKAHDYYERHKHLKGRHKGAHQDPQSGKAHKGPKAEQRKKLAAAIHTLENKLQKLEELIRKQEHAEASVNRKGKAKKERAAKAKNKPKSAADKAKLARENKKYQAKNQQKLKTKAKSSAKSGGGSSKGTAGGASSKKHSLTELKSLATKVRGQIHVAKQKLAAL
jgi:hypothetical protein